MLYKSTLKKIEDVVGSEWLITRPTELELYSYDASFERGIPDAVVFPGNVAQVVAIVNIAREAGIPLVPRGAGTGLSGGSVPQKGIVLCTTRMRRILSIDPINRLAVVEPGVVNFQLTKCALKYGLVFAPDPSSYTVCTLGGNVAENAGGPHCLKYGTTTHHIAALEIVTPEGDIVEVGHHCADMSGPDWVGLIVGSEGLLGIITKITARLIPFSEDGRTVLATFRSFDDVSGYINDLVSILTPVAIEFMDRTTVRAVQKTVDVGYPVDAACVVIAEVDGYKEEVNKQSFTIEKIARNHNAEFIKVASNHKERDDLWLGRRGVGSAFGQSSPAYLSTDFTVPRSKLADMLKQVEKIAIKYGLIIPSVGHAGDGNLHPAVFFNPDDPDMVKRAHEVAKAICKAALELGGTSTGEHGVGLEKRFAMPWQFSPNELWLMAELKNIFDPIGLYNPGKMFPQEGVKQ